jgi:hypothetical protein
LDGEYLLAVRKQRGFEVFVSTFQSNQSNADFKTIILPSQARDRRKGKHFKQKKRTLRTYCTHQLSAQGTLDGFPRYSALDRCEKRHFF